jgi:hypothetical protein
MPTAIKSFKTINSELERLDKTFNKGQLQQFELFNTAYTIVTVAIQQASQNGYFDNPEFIEEFSVCFAKYYFNAVNDSLSSKSDLPTAWALVSKKSPKYSPRFIFLLLGANAHINHDLPLVLLKMMGKEKTDDLLNDVLKIDELLMKNGRQIIAAFNEPNQFLDFLKRHFIFLYYRPIMYLILYWRIRAWHDYRELKETGLKNSPYTKRSVRIARVLLSLYSLLSIL